MSYKILAFDQSSRITGYCAMTDGQITNYGAIDLSSIKDTQDRIKHMFLTLADLIRAEQPDLLVIENVQQQANANTMILLCGLCGMLRGYAYEHEIDVSSPLPTQWRAVLGYRQGPKVAREELKQQSIDYVREHYGIEGCGEDAAEAIAICSAAWKEYKEI